MRRFPLTLPLLALAACQAGNTSDLGLGGSGGSSGALTTTSGDSGTSTSSFAGSSTGTGFSSGTSMGTGGSSDCSDASKLVYVFTTDNEIYSFDPPNKKFTYVASPDCPGGSPNSMAIDRNLVAWINYIGEIDTFDLNKKSGCTKAMDLPLEYEQVGMGFATDTEGGTSETLYVDGIGGGGLAKIDTASKKLTPIGDFTNDGKLSGESAELTGTGSARLFGYFTTSPNVRVAEINKMNANVISDFELKGVAPPDDWAFSFWGGDFYLYAGPNDTTGNSTVVHYAPDSATVDKKYISDAGFLIIGAGVSTCAPIVPPS